MHYKTTYVLPLLERHLYFNSLWHEDEEDAANRFFKMNRCQFRNPDKASNFFEANTDLYFSHELGIERLHCAKGRQYILNCDGGLIAKFYDFSELRWRITYQGLWHLFVNQFQTLPDPLYCFSLSVRGKEVCFLTLAEAKFFVRNLRKQAGGCQYPEDLERDAHFIECQIKAFKKETK